MTNQTILITLVASFSPKNLTLFLREKSRDFKPAAENLTSLETNQFVQGEKVGYIPFNDFENLGIYAIQVSHNLNERSGKKDQYDFAKKILKETDEDAGIFVFYDTTGNFRFSLVFANYLGKVRDYSNFRRFTYFVSPQLTNKTFLQRIGEADFKSLDSIKEAFSVEKVTKDFYQEISYWYFWACQKSQFPEAAEKDPNGRQESIIRLITRLIFIWFMREKGLVPSNLFEKSFAQNVLKNLDDSDSSYYLAILQNLFFATLNTPKPKRQFRSEIRGHRGYNPDFNNQFVYRYHSLFKNPEKLEAYFQNIPFLNGGLFDCLDDKEHGIYIDGFTESAQKNRPKIPNALFFSPEVKADFNLELGTSQKNYKVEGLFIILSRYNFTIDENTVDDKDVALDPEMLGRVFENLLASFNPETSSTARKATGSYYTPREIVDYMVDESLKSYLRESLTHIPDLEHKLGWLFADLDDENPFSNVQTMQIIKAIENVRIVDPAVGSGAFPMGALHRMVSILSKLDPGSQLWKQAQLDAAENIPDPQIREQVQASITNYFLEKNPDYGRKLFLIQKCIYGVDIQPIAVEIAKLRFFISLLVEETVEQDKPNWGIEPLPNLDFKIMQGNSLISVFQGIDFSPNAVQLTKTEDLFSGQDEKAVLIKKFQNKKEVYQSESDHVRKHKLQQEIDQILIDLVRINALTQHADYARELERIDRKYAAVPASKAREDAIKAEKKQVSVKMGIDLASTEDQMRQHSTKQWKRDFFPWALYFAEVFTEKGGFDIVVGNPPYLESRNKAFSETDKNSYQLAATNRWGTESKNIARGADLLVYFIELSICVIGKHGIVSLITQNSWLYTVYGKKFQHFLLRNSYVREIVDSDWRFFSKGDGPDINTIIVFIGKKTKLTNSNLVFKRFLNSLTDKRRFITLDPTTRENHTISRAFQYKDRRLQDTKWGVLLDSSDIVLELFERISKLYLAIEKIPGTNLSYGQGLNLSKNYIVNQRVIEILGNRNALITFFTADDNGMFEISKTSKFIINKKLLTRDQLSSLKSERILPFDPSNTRKIKAKLIMPRGIGRHFCGLNKVNCYSSSCVEIYDNANDLSEGILLNLWLFFNSSVAWLIREVLGRKNLGGGMLKAEAIDLSNFPVYCDYQKLPQIKKILDKLRFRKALPTIEEIFTDEHREIDDIIFNSLSYDANEQSMIKSELIKTIKTRETRSST